MVSMDFWWHLDLIYATEMTIWSGLQAFGIFTWPFLVVMSPHTVANPGPVTHQCANKFHRSDIQVRSLWNFGMLISFLWNTILHYMYRVNTHKTPSTSYDFKLVTLVWSRLPISAIFSRPSHIVMKEKPRKSPRVPPNSATRDSQE